MWCVYCLRNSSVKAPCTGYCAIWSNMASAFPFARILVPIEVSSSGVVPIVSRYKTCCVGHSMRVTISGAIVPWIRVGRSQGARPQDVRCESPKSVSSS